MKIWLLFIALVVTVFFVGPFHSSPIVSSKTLTIVTTFPILKDLTQQIVGDRPGIEVFSIVKGKADPHTYQPKTEDGKIVAKANLIITNGLGFEAGWMNRLLIGSGSKAPLFIAARSINPRVLTQPHRGNPVFDPHAWHNVQNAIAYAKVILEALITLDPTGRAHYEAQFAILNVSLNALDCWVREHLASVPRQKRRIITTHDAFWYYGEAYGVEFLSPVGISTDAEPSAAAIAQLINKIRDEGIMAVFIENLANPRQIEIISQEAGVSIRGTLYADTLSDSAGPAATYQDMIRHNTMTMVKAF